MLSTRRQSKHRAPASRKTQVTEQDSGKRLLIGLITVGCLIAAVVSALVGDWQTASTAALIRVGIVMAALWLAYPRIQRRAFWKRSSRRIIVGLVLVALTIKQLRFILPTVAVVLIVLWFVRPKKKTSRL